MRPRLRVASAPGAHYLPDLHVASSELLHARGIRHVRDEDSVHIVRAGLARILEVNLVFVRAGAIDGGVAEEAGLGAVIATDDGLHIDRVHGERLNRPVIVVLLLPARDPRERHLGIAAERGYVAVQGHDPATIADLDLAAGRTHDPGALAIVDGQP